MSNIVNETNAENILMDVVELNRLELIGELEMGIYEASYLSFDNLIDLVVSKRSKERNDETQWKSNNSFMVNE